MTRMLDSLITAVVPVRAMRGKLENLAHTLKLSVDLEIDVIIVHDDANDGTSQQLQQLVTKLNTSKVVLIEKSVHSPGHARNIGLSLAKTEWVCFWDSDDLPVPSQYLEMAQAASLNLASVGIGAICSMDEASKRVGARHGLDLTQQDWILDLANMPSFTRMVFRRSFVADVRFPAFRMGEDQCFLRDTDFLNQKIYVSEGISYFYITNFEGQLTRNDLALVDLRFSVNYLVSRLGQATGDMVLFSQGQVLKLFVSAMRLSGRLDWFLHSPGTWFRIAILCIHHPLRVLKILRYLTVNRVTLSGR